MAGRGGDGRGGRRRPRRHGRAGRRWCRPPGPRLDDVVASVARGSMDVLSRNVRDLFARYVAEVAERSGDGDDDEPAVDAETAVLLARGGRRPDRAVLPGGVGRAAHHRGPAGAAGRVRDPAPAGRGVPAAAPRAHPAADAGRGAGAAAAVRRPDDGQLTLGSPARPRRDVDQRPVVRGRPRRRAARQPGRSAGSGVRPRSSRRTVSTGDQVGQQRRRTAPAPARRRSRGQRRGDDARRRRPARPGSGPAPEELTQLPGDHGHRRGADGEREHGRDAAAAAQEPGGRAGEQAERRRGSARTPRRRRRAAPRAGCRSPTGPVSVIRKSARGRQPPPEQPGGQAGDRAGTSDQPRRELRRSARISGQPRQ